MQFLDKYIRKYWKPFTAAILFLTLEALCDLMQPTIMANIVDTGVKKKQLGYVIHMGIIMLLITGIGAIAASARNILSGNVSQKFGAELRSDMFKKIQTYSFENADNFEGASLVTRLTNDVTQVMNFVNGLMRVFVKAPLLCIGSIIMAVRLNPPMALVLVFVVPITGVLIFANLQIGYPFFAKVQKALDKVNSVMREYLAGVRVVKAFNRFDYEVERFEKTNQEFGTASITAMRVMAIFTPGITLTINMGIVAVLWFGGYRVNNGSMQVGQVIAFTNYMTQILSSVMMISFVFTMFVRARASAERIEEVFAEENAMKFSEDYIDTGEEKGRVDFSHVFFSYSGASGDPVLKDITFSCKPGETIGIIGSTGSGKSSLVNLIPRFYDAVSGTVAVDGIDVKDMDPEKLRGKIAVVPQKTVLFTGSVIENIRWGREDASEEEVKEAAMISQANDFITSFPEGYNTMLGQGGVNFSGGQKQRVSIARALVRKPEILILDDSTSAVDVATESRIREALKGYIKGLTCFVIAQLNDIASIFNTLQSALAGAERVFEIIDEKDEPKDMPEAVKIENPEGRVVFDHVNFGYRSDVPILKDINFTAGQGSTTALVGPTGAGKTTIVNLLARFYDVSDGRILLDGRDIREYTRDSLRRCFGIVLQDTYLFSGTIKENIRYGRIDASDEEIEKAAAMANADRFIRRLHSGYDTVLSESGSNLSQGQRQLLAIARAILADPPILILDEATSNVDTRTELRIQEAMLKLMKGRTSFVIAHRLSTIRNADIIMVIDEGRIVEKGSHEELIRKNGVYHNMYYNQFKNIEEK